MTIAIPKQVTFDEFIAWYPENSEYRYELHEGVIVQMPKPTGPQSQIAGFLTAELNFEIRRLQLPYFLPKECVVTDNDRSGYEPNVIVLDKQAVKNEPRWEKESTITQGNSVSLIVEVVSTNWQIAPTMLMIEEQLSLYLGFFSPNLRKQSKILDVERSGL